MSFDKLKKYIIIVPVLLIMIICLVAVIEKTKKVDSHILSFQKIRLKMPDEFEENDKTEEYSGTFDTGQINKYTNYLIYDAYDEYCTFKIYIRDYEPSREGVFEEEREEIFGRNSAEPFLVLMGWNDYDGYTPSSLSTVKFNKNKWLTFNLLKTDYNGTTRYDYYAYDYNKIIYILEFKHYYKYDYDKKSYCSKSLNTITNSIYFR